MIVIIIIKNEILIVIFIFVWCLNIILKMMRLIVNDIIKNVIVNMSFSIIK